MGVSESEIKNYKNLLTEFDGLDPIPSYLPTIFEVSGYPHYEDVMSNVLQFFFSSDYDHGFSSIFVKALLNAAELETQDSELSELSVQEVEREYLTKQGNRIDLVIETEGFCIAIEHKIYADLYNDLEEYQDSIKFRSDKKNIYIVLAKGRRVMPKNGDLAFKLVIYEVFFEKLEQQLGRQISSADSKVLMYVGDYIKTIRNLTKRTNMSDEFLNFLSKNRKDLESLYKHAFKNFKNEIKKKAKKIDGRVELNNSGFQSFRYNPQDQLKYVQGYKKVVGSGGTELTLQVKLRIIPDRYVLELWAPNSSEVQFFKDFIEERLEKESFTDWETHDDSENGSIEYKEFNYGENPEKVAKEVKELIVKVG